jgi:4-amino-4-deoxy-L-arabinose transferase-like glycosyltransferase
MALTNRRASPLRDAAALVLAALALASSFAITAPLAAAATAAAAAGADVPGDDIRDIRGPKGVFPLWLILVLLAAIALLIIGAYALWRWKRRRQRPRPLTHLEIVLQRLEATRALMQPSTVREFSIAISDIVRGHIEYAFDVTATQRTTEEFLHDLLGSSNAPSANASLAAHRSLLEEFLYRCDVAKFAGVTLSQQIMESLYQSARRFVIETSKPAAAVPTKTAPTDHPIGT